MIIDTGYLVYTIDRDGDRTLRCVCLDAERARKIGLQLYSDSPLVVAYILERVDVV